MKLKNLLKEVKINEGLKDDLREFKTKLAAEIAKNVDFPTRIYLDEGDFDGEKSNTSRCTSASAYAQYCIKIIFNVNGYEDFNEYLEMYSNWDSEQLDMDSLVKSMCAESTKENFGVGIDENTAVFVWSDEE